MNIENPDRKNYYSKGAGKKKEEKLTEDRPSFGCVRCRICNKWISKKGLKSHEKRHSGVKPHSCDVCSKAFYEKRELKRHLIKVHKIMPPAKPEVRSNSCDVCGKTFKAKQAMKHRSDTDESMCIKCFKLKWFTAVRTANVL